MTRSFKRFGHGCPYHRSRWPDSNELWSSHLLEHTCSRAFELHGLEKASSALLSELWSGTYQNRGHFSLRRSDQRPILVHTSLIRGQFECTLVLSEAKSSELFSSFLFYWQMISLPRVNNTAAFWSETRLDSDGVDQNKGVADSNCQTLFENKIEIIVCDLE